MVNPSDIERANRIVNKYSLSLVRGTSDPAVGELISATSNEQKIAILLDMRARLPQDEYQTFVNEAVQNGVISTVVGNTVELRATRNNE